MHLCSRTLAEGSTAEGRAANMEAAVEAVLRLQSTAEERAEEEREEERVRTLTPRPQSPLGNSPMRA